MHKSKVWLLVRGDIFCQGLKVYLAQWGLQVVEHPFGQEVAAELTGGQEPALVIMDYKSRFSKPEAVLLTNGHTIPILFLVAHQEVFQTLPAQVQPVNSYCCLPKPCPIQDLQDAVERLLGIRMAHREAPEEVVSPFSLPLSAGR